MQQENVAYHHWQVNSLPKNNSQCSKCAGQLTTLMGANPNGSEAQQRANGRQPRHHPPSEPLHLGGVIVVWLLLSVISARQIMDTVKCINEFKLNYPAAVPTWRLPPCRNCSSSDLASPASWFWSVMEWYLGLPFLPGEPRVAWPQPEAEDSCRLTGKVLLNNQCKFLNISENF